MHRVLVTGGTGFLGSEIVKALVETKLYYVTALDVNPPALGTATYPDVDYVRGNVLILEELEEVFRNVRPSIVVHTVGVSPQGNARYSNEGRDALFEINVTGTKNVLAAARKCGATGLVYTSSITVITDDMDGDFPNVDESAPVGNATLLYGRSKTAAEHHVLAANASDFYTCALRPAPVFGPNDYSIIPTIHSCIAKFETPFIVGSGENLADFVYISNVADAHVLAVHNLLSEKSIAAGHTFFITNGEPVAFRDFCVAIWKEFGHVPPFQVQIPKSLAWSLGLLLEWMTWIAGSQATLSRGSVKDACAVRYANLDKAKRGLGYSPRVGLEEGIKRACEHYRERLAFRK